MNVVPPAAASTPPPLRQSYVMVTFIPYYVGEDGGIWLERLWHRDFVRHMTYIHQLTLVAPALKKADATGIDLVQVVAPPGVTVRYVAIGRLDSRLAAVKGLPQTARVIWNELAGADIVHTGIAGWPYPIGWLAGLVAMLRKKALVIVVESAPWRFTDGSSLPRRATAAVYEGLARFFVNRAAVSFFTQPTYQQTMLTRGKGPGFIIPATWIDEHEVLARQAAEAAWAVKRTRPVRLLFAARLQTDKGTLLLLEALRLLRKEGFVAHVDIIGDGPLRADCAACAAEGGSVKVELLAPVSYGAPFFTLLREYHAVLVPNLGDEQPRIVFDAYAQALPVIASRSAGLRPNVEEGTTGWLFEQGDVAALASAIRRASTEVGSLADMGLRALAKAASMTHMQMHVDRWRHLAATLGT